MITPQRDLIFVKVGKQERHTESGIFLPKDNGLSSDRGLVVAVGSGKTYSNGDIIPLTVRVGDHILFNERAGQTTKLDDGTTVLVMREDDVFAILEECDL